MGDDIRIENYKKSVTKILDAWGKEAEKVGKELAPIQAELDKLEEASAPTPDDKKRMEELKKKRDDFVTGNQLSWCFVRKMSALARTRISLRVAVGSPTA